MAKSCIYDDCPICSTPLLITKKEGNEKEGKCLICEKTFKKANRQWQEKHTARIISL